VRAYGLIGYPLSHSFSKKYFSQKFETEQISDAAYELYPLPDISDLSALLKRNADLKGLNVTIPYKESVLPFLHHKSKAVEEIGACNCIKIQNGILSGYNTDVIGFEQTLTPLLLPHDQQALILGTGGAAKAVAWVLKQNNILYRFVSRKAGANCISYEQITAPLLETTSIIINTTPLGMQPNVDAMPSLPVEWLSAFHLCIDLIYNPSKTLFLVNAEKQGSRIKNGLQMLEVQAIESWNIWNDPHFL
jgi:shikimate dehydrogenase